MTESESLFSILRRTADPASVAAIETLVKSGADRDLNRANRLHRIDATKALAAHTAASKMDTSWAFFTELRDAGREAAEYWLKRHYDEVGVKGTFDLSREFV